MEWLKTENGDYVTGVEVIGYHDDWVDPDFNPKGTRIGFFTDEGEFCNARWNDSQDTYITDYSEVLPTHYAIITYPLTH